MGLEGFYAIYKLHDNGQLGCSTLFQIKILLDPLNPLFGVAPSLFRPARVGKSKPPLAE